MSNKRIGIKGLLRNEQVKGLITVVLQLISLALGAFIAFNLYCIKNNYSAVEQETHSNDDGIMMENSNDNEVYQNSDIYKDSHVENNSFYSQLIDEDMNENTLLQYAENAYNSGNYQEAVKIYSMYRLRDSFIALTNMGYFYANGLYFREDLTMADAYYDRAIENGSSKALENKIAMHLRCDCQDSFELLKRGYEAGNNNVKAFLSYSLYNYCSNYASDDNEDITHWILYEATNEEQESFINSMYKWIEEGIVFLTYSPEDTALTKYIWYDDDNWVDEENGLSGTIHHYKKYSLRCSFLEILEEEIEHTNREVYDESGEPR